MKIPIDGSKVTSAIWGPYEETIITAHENGEVSTYELKVTSFIELC